MNRARSWGHAIVILTYAYDGLGNILQLDDGVNLITHHYSYDHLNRLTLANGVGTNPYSESYAYDRIGNILSKTDAGNDYRYTIPNKPHAVSVQDQGVRSIFLASCSTRCETGLE